MLLIEKKYQMIGSIIVLTIVGLWMKFWKDGLWSKDSYRTIEGFSLLTEADTIAEGNIGKAIIREDGCSLDEMLIPEDKQRVATLLIYCCAVLSQAQLQSFAMCI